MALSPEWEYRIKRWEEGLWNSIYVPLERLGLEGFATTLRLTAEQAAAGNFRPMPEGTAWGSKWEYGWFRARYTVPGEAS
nr:hypothetical protein [Anaerolinea sp.]